MVACMHFCLECVICCRPIFVPRYKFTCTQCIAALVRCGCWMNYGQTIRFMFASLRLVLKCNNPPQTLVNLTILHQTQYELFSLTCIGGSPSGKWTTSKCYQVGALTEVCAVQSQLVLNTKPLLQTCEGSMDSTVSKETLINPQTTFTRILLSSVPRTCEVI